MDPEEDVVMIHLASSGTRGGRLDVVLPPLDLLPLTGPVVRGLLDEADIKWRIVVVAACASGAWIDALQSDHTLVMTATRPDESSPACEVDARARSSARPCSRRAGAVRVDGRGDRSGAFAAARRDAPVRRVRDGRQAQELERGSAARRSGRSV